MGERMCQRTATELSSYPTDLDAHVTLTDQRRIRLRALHSREERPIRVLHARLSPRTRYLRFLSPIPNTSLGVSELVFVRRRSWGNAVPGSAVGGEWPVAPQRRGTRPSLW